MVSWERTDGWIDDGVFLGGVAQPRGGSYGMTIVWTVSSGRTHHADFGPPGDQDGPEEYLPRLVAEGAAGDQGTLRGALGGDVVPGG